MGTQDAWPESSMSVMANRLTENGVVGIYSLLLLLTLLEDIGTAKKMRKKNQSYIVGLNNKSNNFIVVSVAGNQGSEGVYLQNSPGSGSKVISVASVDNSFYLTLAVTADEFPDENYRMLKISQAASIRKKLRLYKTLLHTIVSVINVPFFPNFLLFQHTQCHQQRIKCLMGQLQFYLMNNDLTSLLQLVQTLSVPIYQQRLL